ncbi:hypothetical protein FSP39_017292 [Pinctada imbricata]|uniref:C-factor n=1 Tax=Pinctada imbricata TaxID=66713 RepID=A0AA88XZT8_PINIB|nr:hypothetical protein FSP39_017292 [Pinctada imbricata]
MSFITLIQGASRGIGLQFCRSLLARDPGAVVIATCRNPDGATDLKELQSKESNRLHVCKLDITNEQQIVSTSEFVKENFGKLDLLINSAGMLHPSGKGETSLRDVSMEALTLTMQTNTFGPLLMGKYFGPFLTKGSGSVGVQSSDPKQRHTAVLVNMSAKVGSITDNGLGGWYSYRMSKSALNMATKNLSIELGRGKNKVICVSLHPGTVDTDLSRPYHKNVPNLFSTEYSVNCLLSVIDSLTVADTGKFLTYDRTVMAY